MSLRPACVSTGTHSLHYYYLTLSEPGPSLPKFLAVGYVDDQPFIRFDSRVGKAEPQAPWMTPMDAQYWETETRKQEKWAEVQQVEMWTVMGYHNHSSGALGGLPMLHALHTDPRGSHARHRVWDKLLILGSSQSPSPTAKQGPQGLRIRASAASPQASAAGIHRSRGPMIAPPLPLATQGSGPQQTGRGFSLPHAPPSDHAFPPRSSRCHLSFPISAAASLQLPPRLLLILNKVLMEHSLFTQHPPALWPDTPK